MTDGDSPVTKRGTKSAGNLLSQVFLSLPSNTLIPRFPFKPVFVVVPGGFSCQPRPFKNTRVATSIASPFDRRS